MSGHADRSRLRSAQTTAAAPSSPSDWLNIARAYWQSGHPRQVEICCAHVLEAIPEQPDALYLLTLVAHAEGRIHDAIEHLGKACHSRSAPAQFFSDLAELYRLASRLPEAETSAREAIRRQPALTAAWNNLGIILQAQGHWKASLECLLQAGNLDPHLATLHNNLGNTLRCMGRLDEARQHFEQALAEAPDYASAHCNLAVLLNQMGQSAQGIAQARRAIELDPHLLEAYQVLIDLHLAGYDHAAAQDVLRAMQAVAPGHPACLTVQARVEQAIGCIPEALSSVRQVLAATPDDQAARLQEGILLQQLDDAQGAARAFARAAALPGRHALQIGLNQASLDIHRGNTQAACIRYGQLMEAFPESLEAACQLINARRVTSRIPALERLEHCTPEQLPLDVRILRHFALGKAYLDLGETDQAFAHYDAGNALKRGTYFYDADLASTWMQHITDSFAAPALPRQCLEGEAAMPVFIVGMPRSGTTLVEQILASHPQVTGIGEQPFLRQVVESCGIYPDAAGALDMPARIRLGQDYLARIRPMAHDSLRLLDKMPSNFLYVGMILQMLPGARIIHCRRNPLDTCLSCYTQLFAQEQKFAYDQTELGRCHRDYSRLMSHWRKYAPPERFIEVEYEALVHDLEGNARRLLNFLDLPWDSHCLRFHETARLVRTASATQVRQPLYSHSIGRGLACAKYLQALRCALEEDGDAAPAAVATTF